MPVDAGKIAEMERQLAEAKAQLLQEHGKRYEIILREISPGEKQRILDGLTDKQERILFGLEIPDEPRKRGRKPGAGKGRTEPKEGADFTCDICHKGGFTERGLNLHKVRMHKDKPPEEEAA